MDNAQVTKILRCCDIQRRTIFEHELLKDRLDAILKYGPTRAKLSPKQEAALDSMLTSKPVYEPKGGKDVTR